MVIMNMTAHTFTGGNGSVGLLNISKPLDLAINYFSVTILILTMISLGCSMEIPKIKAHFVTPKGIIIALLAQFLIMPLTAFSLAKVLHMGPMKAVAVLICGCCPGGNLSNIFALALKGDMNLSIVMTTCSCIAALGLMPLQLYLFSQGFPGLENSVPYVGIISALILALVPCAVGIAINHYRPKYSPIVQKVGIGIMMVSGVVIFAMSFISVKEVIWMVLTWDVLLVAGAMPAIGFSLGYVMSLVCKLNQQCSRTIAMETGCQNIQLCTTILKVTFPLQVIGPMFLFPLLYISFQCAEALLLTLSFRCFQVFNKPSVEDSPYLNSKQEEVKQP
ncbi:sodium/bile acid cotransporter-like [Gouania willdenowi]|uniref:Hepatic sodium/bile acid cotransporter n=1 Tax=Gouania willdenowi TaxID=441366 RepID=A0A8C5HHM9_GOUWI|nr:sodium/bile acid cotransporter-like [Gouania willdenowi]XP_028293884.1 sodium/bile acid cotransporter-like [Gouania willdenowi]